jgi:hypothetical protein
MSTRTTRSSPPRACARSSAYVALERSHLERKVAALSKYASQQHRRYADSEYIWNIARTHGINVSREYAEVFQVYRLVV